MNEPTSKPAREIPFDLFQRALNGHQPSVDRLARDFPNIDYGRDADGSPWIRNNADESLTICVVNLPAIAKRLNSLTPG